MATSFKDYFSKQAQDYAKYRPYYPVELFEHLGAIAPNHQTAWDCGTGNGQVALGLTPYFQQIYATDASAAQVAQAFPHERIQYQVAAAERTELKNGSVDLITVGQALHWFNLDLFYQEVRRVGKPGSAIAIWCYGFFELPASAIAINQVLQEFYELIEPFWPPERQLVNQRYQTLPFPFAEDPPPVFAMTADWTIDHLVGYLFTWSATQRWAEQEGTEALEEIADRLKAAWGNPSDTQLIQWPLHLRIGHVG